jgi:addiction module HigA family antidote
MAGRRVCAVHPGEILREEFMRPLALTAYRLGKELHVPLPRINDLVHERRAMTADTALRLEKYFGMPARFWMALQADYDLRLAAGTANTAKIKPRPVPRAAPESAVSSFPTIAESLLNARPFAQVGK